MHVLKLGTNTTTGETISLSDTDRRQHLYAIGQTGTGKTTWLLGLMAQDVQHRKGFCFIDKHGDAEFSAISRATPNCAHCLPE